MRQREKSRLNESVERALELSGGELIALYADDDSETRYSRRYSCPQCGDAFSPLHPQRFSFNHQQGMCSICEGLGEGEGVDRELIIADPSLSVRDGAIALWGAIEDEQFISLLETAGQTLGFDIDIPFSDLTHDARRALLYGGSGDSISTQENYAFRYRGVLPVVDEMARRSNRLKRTLKKVPCSACEGSRLNTESRHVYLRERSIADIARLPIDDSLSFFADMQLDDREGEIAGELLQEIRTRLDFLERAWDSGISLNRRTATLSGGERSASASPRKSDPASRGCFTCSTNRPLAYIHVTTGACSMRTAALRDLGNTLVVVEHDRETLQEADYIVDMGPGAGREGGEVVASGSHSAVQDAPNSQTGAYLRDELHIDVPTKRRKGKGEELIVRGVRQNNLRNIDVTLPLGKLIGITGVSGSGKSSLVEEVLYNALANQLHKASRPVGEFDGFDGIEHIDKIINIDQTPIGNSPRSTPATVMGVFDLIRQLYAELPDAKLRGFKAGRFSFNKPGGRCETCEGLGWRCIEMHFLPDVWVECDTCGGKRYTGDSLRIRFKGHSIADVLEMRVRDALLLFDGIPRIRQRLQIMDDVGLGYMSLGQSSTTLSGARPSGSSCRRAGPSRYRPHPIPTRRADYGTALCRRRASARRAPSPGRRRQHHDCRRAQYRRDKNGRPHYRSRSRGRRGGGAIVAEGTPEAVARTKQSHTGAVPKRHSRRREKNERKSARWPAK